MTSTFKYKIVEKFLDAETLQTVIENFPEDFEEGRLISHPGRDHSKSFYNYNARKQKVAWIHENETNEWQWLFDKVKFAGSECPIPINLAAYYSFQCGVYGPGNYYKMHTDSDGFGVNPRNRRMLSVTILLQHAEEGGEFEFEEGGIVHLNPGDAIFFDSTLRHQVCEVKKGIRKSLVIWFDAPPDYSQPITRAPDYSQHADEEVIHEITLPNNFDREGLIDYIDHYARDEGETCEAMLGCYKPPIAEQLLRDLLPTVKKMLGKDDLWICNSYARIYKKGSSLVSHVDREGLEYVITFTLQRDHDWAITIGSKTYNDNDTNIGYLFEAIKIPHGRPKPYEGEKCYQLFLHYTSDQKFEFDKVPIIGRCVEENFDRKILFDRNILTLEQCRFLLDQYDEAVAECSNDFMQCKTLPTDKITWRKDICNQIRQIANKIASVYQMDSYVCTPQIVQWPENCTGNRLRSDYGDANQYPWREYTAIIPLNHNGCLINIPRDGTKTYMEQGDGVLFKGGVMQYGIKQNEDDQCYSLVMFFAPKFNWSTEKPEWPDDNFMEVYEDDSSNNIDEQIESPAIVKSTNVQNFTLIDRNIVEADFPARELITPHAAQMITEFKPDYDLHPNEREGCNRPYNHFPFRMEIAVKFIEAAQTVFENVTDDIYEEDGYFRTKQRRITPYTYIQNNRFSNHDWHHHIKTSTINAVIYYDIPKIGGEIEFFTDWYSENIKVKPKENKIYFFPYYLFHHPCPQEDPHWRININLEILQNERPRIRGTDIMW